MTTGVAVASAWAMGLAVLTAIGATKREAHASGTSVNALDTVLLAAAAALGPLTGSPLVTFAVAAVALVAFTALWLDAVLFRVYSIELGLRGVRGIVLPVLYEELTEVQFARRFLAGRPAFLAAPFIAALAFAVPLMPWQGQAAVAALVLWVVAEAAAAASSRVSPGGESRCGAFAVVRAGENEVAGAAQPGLKLPGSGESAFAACDGPRGGESVFAAFALPRAGESAFAAFVLPRRLRRAPTFEPREEHRSVLSPRPAIAGTSPRHGVARGADVFLWTFESASRDALSLYGGPAQTPFLDSLARGGAWTSNHFAPCPMTTEAHQALYTSSYRGDLDSALPLLKSDGYRCVYLTPYRTAHYGLAAVIDRFGFDAHLDRAVLSSGRDSELLSRGLELVLAEAKGAPVFLHVHTANAHLPYFVEDSERFRRFPSNDDRGRYLNSLEETDALLSRFVSAFSAARGAPPLVAVSSDHGQSFGERGYRSHGSAVTREQLNVPLVLSHPALGSSTWRWSSHFDVLPTLLDLVGVADSRAHFGRSVFAPGDRFPSLVLWAGRPARSTCSHIGLLHGDRKFSTELVLGRTEATDWNDVPQATSTAEQRYLEQLLAHAFADAGLR